MVAAPSITPGQWVQLNPTTQSPRAGKPTAIEQTIGLIRSAYTAEGKDFFQVVWNPGSSNPATALYTEDELTPITQQQANDIAAQMNAGTYTPSLGSPGSQYVEPSPPSQALPPTGTPWFVSSPTPTTS